ncbi:MAG: phenylalanine--tRNA ligase subunit beta [Fermentimonas sp.]|jgi:phenylalanyl-tRNA synthetase beta chain
MNISFNWLKEYLEFDLTPQETADVLTSIGLEVEGLSEIQTVKGGMEGLVVGEVLTCEKHPNADSLSVTTVLVEKGGEPLSIVCGAPNVAAGQKVVVATSGTVLYDGDESFKIKKTRLRGIDSFGMICSEKEIGISNNHNGIIVLPNDVPVGTLAKDYYDIKSDWIIEVDITPNRVDAASHYGVARDLAAWLKQAGKPYKLTKPSVDNFMIDKQDGGIKVKVENSEACPRYTGLTIRGVDVKESPEWLKNKLLLIGLRPINNIVDITNFVLHETGHPMHAFDASVVGETVIVKTLEDKTKFVTLDEQERELSDRDLMICNEKEGMCMAGVFGGVNSGVTEKTEDVFLESAYFHPTWVRKTARRHGLNTDSSFRFERGADPNNTMYVIKRAALLIKELAGGTIEGDIVDIYPNPIDRPRVELSYDKVNSIIGKEIGKNTVKSILDSLEIEIEKETSDVLTVRVPTYRSDVTRDVDIIEDILRIYGYNNVEIGQTLKSSMSYQTITDMKNKKQSLISEQLTASGFNEIMNNSLTKTSYYDKLKSFPAENCVKLVNPLSGDLGVMRQTLLFGGLESIAYNSNRKNTDLSFYEFGNCYFYDESKRDENKVLAQYSENTFLGIWLTGRRTHKNWVVKEEPSTVFELKAHVENILNRIGITHDQVYYKQIENDVYSVCMSVNVHKKNIGSFGVISKDICNIFDIDNEVFYAEIDWDTLIRETNKNNVRFKEIPKFPAVSRDLALLVDENISFADIEQIAFKCEKELLKSVTLFDVYEGKNLPQGKKSYAVNFLLQDEKKTLKDDQIDSVMKKIQKNLENKIGAQLR